MEAKDKAVKKTEKPKKPEDRGSLTNIGVEWIDKEANEVRAKLPYPETTATKDSFLEYQRVIAISGLVTTNKEQHGLDGAGRMNLAAKQFYSLEAQDGTESLLDEEVCKLHNLQDELVALAMCGTNDGSMRIKAANAASTVSRTVASLLETKRRYRTGGEQIVKHVHVNDGGQAIVGMEGVKIANGETIE